MQAATFSPYLQSFGQNTFHESLRSCKRRMIRTGT